MSDHASPLTVGSILDYVAPKGLTRLWPPDVFAVVACLLQKSGAYKRAITAWPPGTGASGTEAEKWVERIRDVSRSWRNAMSNDLDAPEPVRKV